MDEIRIGGVRGGFWVGKKEWNGKIKRRVEIMVLSLVCVKREFLILEFYYK